MPSYDFRCRECGAEMTLFYKTTHAYSAATPTCTACGSTDLSRIIKRVNVAAPNHDYSGMSADQMLGVLESGDKKQVNDMVRQVNDSAKKSP